MGSLILCHDQHAAHPYEITRIHCKIFTMEELCYYLCNNLYLIDYTIMNGQLCDWLDEELEMKALASELRDVLRLHGSVRMAGRGHREKGACRPASGCDPDAGKCGKICTHDFEEFRNLQGSGDDPNPECSGAAQKPEGH